MDNALSREIKRLRNLRQNKNKDSSAIEKIAQKNIWLKQTNIAERFSSNDDKKLAEKIFGDYLENYTFENWTDVQNVADLVFEEITKLKTQQQIAKINSDENTKFVPDKLIESLHKIEEKIYDLKERAGIVGSKEQNDLTALQELEKKFQIYIAYNRNEFTVWLPVNCKQCGSKDVQPILLRRRVKDFEALKHPAFSGRFLFNIEIIDDVENNKITKEQASRYLHTSVRYIDWVIANRHKIIEIEDVSKEDIDKFINDTPHLGKSTDYIENNFK